MWKVIREWEIHALVLASLFLQTLLLLSGGSRKRNVSWWKPFFIWAAYLLADYVAIYTLGILSRRQKLDGEEEQLLLLWAPFLLLHLGGQDTITAYAIEDNELWLRHLVSLVSQVFLAAYVYSKSHPSIVLMRPAIIMFVAGFVKYSERILALWAASMGSFRSSMLTPPNPGRNYARFVEEYQYRRYAGHTAQIVIVEERAREDAIHAEVKRIGYDEVMYHAHRFFQIFRRLFVDLVLSLQDCTDSIDFFAKLEMDQAFKVVEIELMLMYESMHSKALIVHNAIGRVMRAFTLAAPMISLWLFSVGERQIFTSERSSRLKVEIAISYMLLAGAIVLETYSWVLIITSPWTYVHLRAGGGKLQPFAKALFRVIKFQQQEKMPTWSNKTAHYNLISYCLHDKPQQHTRLMEWLEWKWNFRVKTLWDGFWYTDHFDVSLPLKSLIFSQLKSKAAYNIKHHKNYLKFGDHRGHWALQRKGLIPQLGWSIDVEFDESLLIWHIATDLCFYEEYRADNPADKSSEKRCGFCSCYGFKSISPYFCSCSDDGKDSSSEDEDHSNRGDPILEAARTCREISNYMLYLLVMLPYMMPPGIGQIRFGDTCAEAKDFFRRSDELKQMYSEYNCAKVLSDVDTEVAEPSDVKGDKSKSVLFQGCKLAKQLKSLEQAADKRWKFIASVWVEMMFYAAGKCKGEVHVKQLSKGGELLTVVWLLMSHFRVGNHYRVDTDYPRAKLIIDT